MESFIGTPNSFWALVVRHPTMDHIGNMTVYIDEPNSVPDVGILIGERVVWGKGYGPEAWKAVCDYLFRVVGIRKVTAGTLAVNSAMLGVMRSTGMFLEARRVRQCLFEGREVDMVYAAFFRENWLGG